MPENEYTPDPKNVTKKFRLDPEYVPLKPKYQPKGFNYKFLLIPLLISCSVVCAFYIVFYKSDNGCPRGYTYFKETGICYKAATFEVSFLEAKDLCESEDAHLASIHSQDESDFLMDLYQKSASTSYPSFWLGDDSAVEFGDFSAGRTSPDPEKFALAFNQRNTDSRTFDFEAKEEKKGFICKKQVKVAKKRRAIASAAKPGKPKPAHCSAGYTWFAETNQCYKAVMKKKLFDEAEIDCQSDGANLASIHSESESVFIAGLYHSTFLNLTALMPSATIKYMYWVGLKKTKGAWKWTDGSALDFERWEAKETKKEKDFKWTMMAPKGVAWYRKGEEKGGSICKKPSAVARNTPSRPSGATVKMCKPEFTWLEATQSCYLISTKNVNFEEAQRSCKDAGANLVSINTNTEKLLLNGLIMKTLSEKKDQLDLKEKFWIGLTVSKKQYTWTDGSPAVLFDWWPKEPTYTPGKDLVLWTYSKGWQPSEPSQNGFICKVEPGNKVTTTTQKPKPPCSDGYTYFEETNFCYKAVIVKKAFNEAESDCKKEGGHLASSHSELENFFIAGLYHSAFLSAPIDHKYMYWIGLHRDKKVWKWTDDSPVDYQNWDMGDARVNSSSGWTMFHHAGIQWYRKEKNEKGCYVCKKSSTRSRTGTESAKPTGVKERKCLLGYQWFEPLQACYMVSSRSVTFGDAVKACKEDKANLVSIHSKLENILVNGLVMQAFYDTGVYNENARFWLGLTGKNGADYSWTDGTPADFIEWKNQPGYSKGANLVQWDYFKGWQHAETSALNGFICKAGKGKKRRSLVAADSARCSQGYTWFEKTNSCYKAGAVKKSFDAAETECQSTGAHLASIHSEIESIFIAGLYHSAFFNEMVVSNNLKATKYAYWIGLSRPNGKWTWTDGSSLDFNLWKYGDSKHNTDLNYTHVDVRGIQWHRKSGQEFGYVCKKPSTLSASQQTTLPAVTGRKCMLGYYWLEATQSCYMVSTKNVGFEDAEKSCKEDNAQLASVHSKGESILLNGLIMKGLQENEHQPDVKKTFWFGLTVKKRDYTWTDGSAVDFYDWMGKEPTYIQGRDMGVWKYFEGWKLTNASLNGYICKMGSIAPVVELSTTTQSTVEELPAQNFTKASATSCSTGYTYFEETEFCYKVGLDRKSFDDAQAACEAEQANLASIHSDAEFDLVDQFFTKNTNNTVDHNGYFWIGINYKKSWGWEWTDGTYLDYVNWQENEPSQVDNSNDYVVMSTSEVMPEGNGWRNIGDQNENLYICKKGAVEDNKCKLGYRYFATTNSCYKINIPKVTFAEAKRSCEDEGSQVASIHSHEENVYIGMIYNKTLAEYRQTVDLLQDSSSLWIGYQYEDQEWNWTDGTDTDFKNWAPGEPNQMEKGDFATVMVLSKIEGYSDGNKWNNIKGHDQQSFVCKRGTETSNLAGVTAEPSSVDSNNE